MSKIRGRLAVIVAKVVGIVLLVMALGFGQEAFEWKTVKKEDLFAVTGPVTFAEQGVGSTRWTFKRQVLVKMQDYPAIFYMGKKAGSFSAVDLSTFLNVNDTVSLFVSKDQLALLYTKTTLRAYGLYLINGQPVYTQDEALRRDQKERLSLYVQAAICLLGGVVLLWLPKKYLIKESK